ncbi:MAG: dicarboxylate/amino acid:cation symporter [Candidatus Aminicenantes bacterium]|nr:dicarboxylate/amino acid:cation symporter [Candidatus Aminicenantes bacterium]
MGRRLAGVAAAAVLGGAAIALGTPAASAAAKIVQTLLLLGALAVLALTALRKSGVPTKILAGLFLGAVAGLVYGPDAAVIRPVGTAFIRLIKMVIIPLIFASLLVGVASLGDLKKLGRVGGKTIAFFLIYYVFAVALGLFLANTLKPGSNIPESVQTRLKAEYGEAAGDQARRAEKQPGLGEVLVNIIPDNPAQSLVQADMLQIIFFAMFMGVVVTLLDKKKMHPVLVFFEAVNDIMVKIVHVVIRIAPYAVFALIASVVGTFGADILMSLLRYSLVTIGGLLILAATYPAAVSLLARYPYFKFWKGIFPAQLLAFSTSSSSATLPVSMECAEETIGVSREITSFVLPLGATINMNGTALYQGVTAVFIAQVYGLNLSLVAQLTIVLTATLASIGAAGAPAMGVLMLVIVLRQVGIPLEGIALIMGVERILDMFRTAMNITGDIAAAAVVAHSEGERLEPRVKDGGIVG